MRNSASFVKIGTLVTFLSGFALSAASIPPGSKVYVNQMEGFGTYLTAALSKKKVPVVVIADKEKADFEITGASESQKAGWAKMIFANSIQSRKRLRST